MKPIPDDPRILHILDVFWREIKSINWHEFQTFSIVVLSRINITLFIPICINDNASITHSHKYRSSNTFTPCRLNIPA